MFSLYDNKTMIWYIYIPKQNKNIAVTNWKYWVYQILRIHSL